jgi:hypothetical protein
LEYSGGVVGVVMLAVGLVLLFTGGYPKGLYDLVVGADRWILRTVAYAALLTDRYPPLRLDQGGEDPAGDLPRMAPPKTAQAPRPRSAASVAGRIAMIIAGVLMLVTGSGAVLGGATALALHASRDGGGFVTSDPMSLSTATAAITAEGIEIHPGDVFGREVGGLDAVRITVVPTVARPLFLGVAREADVDAWLSGTAHDELAGIYGGNGVQVRRSVGAVVPVSEPTAESFWLASSSGTGTLRLDWTPGDGRFAVVLANADGTPGVQAVVDVAAKVTLLRPLGVGLVVGGLVAGLLALLLIYFGAIGLSGGSRRTLPPAPPVPPRTAPSPPADVPPTGPPALSGSGSAARRRTG